MPRELDVDALDFTRLMRPGETVCWGQAAAEPLTLTRTLLAQRASIGGFKAFIGMGWSETADIAYSDHVRFISYCATGSNRRLAAAGKLDILPVHYSALGPILERQVDVLLLQLAPARDEGTYSLGLACEYLAPLIATARLVIAEVNDQAPFTFCDRPVRPEEIDVLVRTSRRLPEIAPSTAGAADAAIASHVADLVEDGAVLQIGLGALPDRIVRALSKHRDLGIHSGLITDGMAELMALGIVTNAKKTVDAGASVAGLLAGTAKLAEFAHRNPAIFLRSTSYTHSAEVLERLDRFTAINSAVEVDLTGQINAEGTNGRYVGAVGGAVDFLRGAGRAKGGLPIVALPSTANTAQGLATRIVARVNGPVSTARADAGIIVTEHGIADLRGLTVAQRVRRMLDIAAPEFRESLELGCRDC